MMMIGFKLNIRAHKTCIEYISEDLNISKKTNKLKTIKFCVRCVYVLEFVVKLQRNAKSNMLYYDYFLFKRQSIKISGDVNCIEFRYDTH